MKKTTFNVIETYSTDYEMKYDEKALKEKGYDSISDYVNEEGNGNPWALVGYGVIEDIERVSLDLIETEYETLQFNEEE